MTPGLERGSDFDFVIVGAGSAGCVLANRLSADPNVTVCLIEAGPPDRSWLIHVPAAVAALLRHPVYNWNFTTTPQQHLDGRVIPLPRGRVLGGTSSINGMVYIRGHRKDFDDWAAMGNPGWSFREVLPYFLRSECNEDYRNSPWHRTDGPLNVMHVKRRNPLIPLFIDTALAMGYPYCEDFSGPNPEGFGPRQSNLRGGRRESTATSFLKPALGRPNLEVITDVLARRIIIENGRATGVEIGQGGATRLISAKREIVISCGAFGSPQLLMLSGIGDGDALQKLGIVTRHHLPEVGGNLHDHVATTTMFRTKSTESYGLSWRALPRGIVNIFEYLLFRQGPLASNVYEAHALIRSLPELDQPDLQIVFIPAHRNPSGFPIPLGHGYGNNVVLLHPKSRGQVALASPDPHAAPLIDPNMLSAKEDIEPLLRGLRIARRILYAPAFERFNSIEISPGRDVTSDEDLRAYIRRSAVTVFHPCGTCRMGGDGKSVVDPELRVRGVNGLRVADASIFPKITGANINASVIMIAEKAADMILGHPALAPLDL
ncbi:MAG: GMC family oxidoreductase N-terminal domain-containing protein [Gammaproteobacteria bacterium]|nr:GMC family oxidoreductase N-terminal domain-containing protein [Gammaproteobacteria bacterium]